MIDSDRVLRPRNTPQKTHDDIKLSGMKKLQFEPVTPIKKKRGSDDIGFMTPPGTMDNNKRRKIIIPTKLPLTPESSPQKLVFGKESIYSRTKAVLQRSAGIFSQRDGCLVTRESQYNKIMNFIDVSITNKKSNSLYITGPPGTGKTAQLDSILKKKFLPTILSSGPSLKAATNLHDNSQLLNQSYYELPNGDIENVAIVTLNCIAISHPSAVFNRIHRSFDRNADSKPAKTMIDLQKFMESYSQNTTFVVVLDEMDKLLHSSLNDTQATRTIFELFLLARLPTVRFLLIGVANSLDLKDRFLSRLNLRQDLLPETVVFNPYTADEMYQIIMERVKSVNNSNGKSNEECIFNPLAVKFAARRCSSNTGDLRKLFDILRNSIEIVELGVVTNLKKENSTDFELVKVGMPHVAKVFSQLLTTSSTRSRINKLNMQQRVILCSLVHRERIDIFQNQCSIDDAFDYYVKLLNNRDTFKPSKRNEFMEMCDALESCGLVNIIRGKAQGKTKQIVKLIKTCVDEKEFEEEISKIDLLKRFIAL